LYSLASKNFSFKMLCKPSISYALIMHTLMTMVTEKLKPVKWTVWENLTTMEITFNKQHNDNT
jgi:hypothetical protein